MCAEYVCGYECVLNVIMWLWLCDNGGNMVETDQGDHHKKQLTELGSKKKKLNRN